MKYVALLSGGKDSCFNLVHCQRNGHELVAAASMSPGEGKEEIDSYLYQTVGQDAIELIAQALDVPLYRGIIRGTAVDQRSDYGGREIKGVEGDETEDLFELLQTVKRIHPDIQGVSVGAILSNYQRARVEHVCQRLSLTALSYLWQRDQDQLLTEMIESGLEAVLIKVAGIGLSVQHLGKTLSQMQPTLRSLNERYGAHICGEGGEYESLTLDCTLFKRRLQLQDVETVMHSDSDFASVAYLRIRRATLEEKDQHNLPPVSSPNLLSDEFVDIVQNIRNPTYDDSRATSADGHETRYDTSVATSSRLGPWISMANVQASIDFQGDHVGIEKEAVDCFQLLKGKLESHALDFDDIAFMTVLLSDMSLFPKINHIYRTYLGSNPPGRACVAVELPPNVNVRLDCLAFADSEKSNRKALHIQGLSYWAPANIGPYSQVVSVGRQIFISGQIGMVPSDLLMPSPKSLALESGLSFQHVSRILSLLQDTYGSAWKPVVQCYICWLTDRMFVKSFRNIRDKKPLACVPSLFVGARALPKGALVETQAFAHTGQYITYENGFEESFNCHDPKFQSGDLSSGTFKLHWELLQLKEVGAFAIVITVKGYEQGTSVREQLSHDMGSFDYCQIFSAKIFHMAGRFDAAVRFANDLNEERGTNGITFITTSFIANVEDDWDFAVCALGNHSY